MLIRWEADSDATADPISHWLLLLQTNTFPGWRNSIDQATTTWINKNPAKSLFFVPVIGRRFRVENLAIDAKRKPR